MIVKNWVNQLKHDRRHTEGRKSLNLTGFKSRKPMNFESLLTADLFLHFGIEIGSIIETVDVATEQQQKEQYVKKKKQ